MRSSIQVALLMVCGLASACAVPRAPEPGYASTERLDSLLQNDAGLSSLLPMDEFSVPANSLPPGGPAAGRLGLKGARAGLFTVHEDRFDYVTTVGAPLKTFPTVSFDWVQQNGRVIPIDQGIIDPGHPAWEIAFQAGHAWRSAADAAIIHYAVPFALLERNSNCTHNGVLSWLIGADGRSTSAIFQIASETCAYFKFDMAGRLETRFEARGFDAADTVTDRYFDNLDARLPVLPISAISERHPGVRSQQLGPVATMRPEDMTVYGLVADGKHYRSECPTRSGRYPFCDKILLPSYSTAKSVFGGLALMRLASVVPDAANRKIGDLVAECARRDWGDVSLDNVLDMATGHFYTTELDADESLPAHVEFLYAAKHQDKIDFACNFFPVKAEPGSVWAYHSSDTYLAGTAMRKLLERQTGRPVDLYRQLIADPYWRPLQLSDVVMSTRKTYDETAQPLTGWGLSYLPDDIARIAEWLVTGAPTDDANGIDRRLFEAAMQQAPDDPGLSTGSRSFRYNNGFWAHDIAPYIGCQHPVWVPFMTGYGGIAVVLFPNQTVYYYFSDGYTQRWREAAIESNRLRSMCQ